ncbi:uncharacterized protein [Ptychodera flava]|uniref:uncharacterized protein n=1 Tax=Ptychodera flava TaxID=63121 RepID=UPI00396A7CE8
MAGVTGLIGKLGEFLPERETFSSYVERMEMFFVANGIVEKPGEGHDDNNETVRDRKRAIFLTEIGPEVYSTLKNLLSPSKPKDKSLDEIVRALETHYNPAPLEIAESFHFGTRNQREGESISDYIVALKKLSLHCNYGDFLNRALRDRFVCGLIDERIQNKLLNTVDLTFTRACQIATAMEMAERKTREFRPASSNVRGNPDKDSGTVSKLETSRVNNSKTNEQIVCYRCGGNHAPHTCKFKTSKCYKCEKIGHIASVCRSRANTNGKHVKSHIHEKSKPKGKVQNCTGNSDDENNAGLYSLYSMNTGKPTREKGYTVEVCVNKVPCLMQIDTAADFSIMSKNVYNEKFRHVPLSPSRKELKTYTGKMLDIVGEMSCNVDTRVKR